MLDYMADDWEGTDGGAGLFCDPEDQGWKYARKNWSKVVTGMLDEVIISVWQKNKETNKLRAVWDLGDGHC